MLFESSESMECFWQSGACDGVSYVVAVYGEVLQTGARGGGVLLQEHRQLPLVALVWKEQALNRISCSFPNVECECADERYNVWSWLFPLIVS